MSDAILLFNQAELALASYVPPPQGPTQVQPLIDAGWAEPEALAFVSRYPEVVYRFNDLGTSFSATVFRDTTGNLTLAIRGTARLEDFFPTDSDILGFGMGYDQIVAMANWWRKASTPAGQLVQQYRLVECDVNAVPAGAVVLRKTDTKAYVLDDAPPVMATGELAEALNDDPDHLIDVTGHSLGGHLAMAFQGLFGDRASRVTVFNAPGFTSTDVNQAFMAKLGGVIPTGTSAPIVNVIADEALIDGRPFEVVAGLWSKPGQVVHIAIENQWNSDEPDPFQTRNHSIQALADSLAVYRLLADLSPTLTDADYKAILNQAAEGTAASAERIVDALEALFGVNSSLLEAGNMPEQRDELYKAIYALRDPQKAAYDAKIGLLVVSPTVDSAAELLSQAHASGVDGLAYRYVLTTLDPFVVTGAEAGSLYSVLDTAGQLDIYNPPNGLGDLTEQWMQDRADFLERKLYITSLDRTKFYEDPLLLASAETPNPVDQRGRTYQSQIRNYVDLASGFVASTGGPASALHHFVFGTSDADVLAGAAREDHLFGAGGQDVLTGGAASDYLEGGVGIDAYRFGIGDGEDVLLDIDGKGVIARAGNGAGLAFKVSDTQWGLGAAIYTINGVDLEVTYSGTADKITVRNFDFVRAKQTAFLSIRLVDLPAEPNYDNAIATINGRADDSVAADLVVGSTGADEINASHGGNDWFRMGAGHDYVFDTTGDDLFEGGADAADLGDVGNMGAGDDVFFGDERPADLQAYLAQILDPSAQGTGIQGDVGIGGSGSDLLFSGSADDVLDGGPGGDVLISGAGNDVLLGDADYVSAQAWAVQDDPNGGLEKIFLGFIGDRSPIDGGADVIYAGAGEDWVAAGRGDDYVEASTGNDTVLGEAGADVIFAGGGADRVYGDFSIATLDSEYGADFIDLGPGNDIAWGDGGADLIFGGDGMDILYGDSDPVASQYQGADLLDGGADDDLLYGQGGNDTLIGGPGNDQLVGGEGKDVYIFNRGDGVDVVFDVPPSANAADASIVRFGADITRRQVKFRPGSLFLDVGEGEGIHLEGWDRLNPQASPILDRLEFADGDAMTYGDVLAQGFDIDGTQEDDGGHDDAHPLLAGTGVADRIRGFAGNDELQGWAGNDVLDGGPGNDRLFGMDGDDFLAGAEGADALVGGSGDDDLHGGEGVDALWGEGGNDFLDGGADADILIGGQGDDRYAFGTGDAAFDFDGLTTIAFGPGIAAADLTLRLQIVNTLPVYAIELNGATSDADRMFVQLSSEDQLAAFEFDDGTVLDHAALLRETFVLSQNVLGSSGADVLNGYAGNDFIRAAEGNDALSGMRGDDKLFGEAGDDALDGGAGNDQLLGGNGLDTLRGGEGDDRLEGEGGADLYVIRQGEGSDAIVEANVAGDDVLRLTDAAPAEAALSRRANGDLVVTLNGGSSITVVGQYSGSQTGIERIEFADSTVLVRADLDALAVAPISGTPSDDVLIGTEFGDTLLGQAGADLLDGSGGDDVLNGGAGVDTYVLGVRPGYGTVVEDGTEASSIRLASGVEFDDVRARRAGSDLVLNIRGVDGGLTLPDYYTGLTNWTVYSDSESSITVVALLDYIEEITPPDTIEEIKATYLDDVELKYAIYLQSFGAAGGVIVNVQAPSDASVITNDGPWGRTESSGSYYLNITDVSGGASANLLDMFLLVTADAGAGADIIQTYWSGFHDSLTSISIGSFLYGNAGNDWIEGTDDADVILGGPGDDYLAGAEGNDKYYVFASDTGVDLIDETLDEVLFPGGYNTFSFPRDGIDSLELVDVAFDDVTFTQGQFDSTPIAPAGQGRVYSTLDISWRPESVVRLILPDPSLSKFGVETILFADGKTLTLDRILPQIAPETSGTPGDQATVNGTEGGDSLAADQLTSFPSPVTYNRTTLNGFGGNDNLEGGWENDVLEGGDGDDRLVGAEGDDVLHGGLGNDLLIGGLGNDLYIFNRGDGRDRIADSAGALWLEQNRDTLRFGAEIAPADIRITGDSLDAYLVVLDTNDRVILGGVTDPLASQGRPGVDRIEFADGTVWSRADILSRMGAIPGTPFDDVIGGTNEGDVISGEAGADRLFGFAGNDILRGGDGMDDLEEWDLDPRFTGGGGVGAEPPFIGGGNNLIDGGAGDDYVYHEGHSFVIGDAGNDWIDLYGDNSVIAFNAGDGSDTVYLAGSMTLSLGGGLTTSDLVLSEDSTDLVLTTGGDSVRFSRQFEADPRAWPSMRLQIVGSDIRTYDLNAVISDFYAAQAGDPGFQMVLATSLSQHLVSTRSNEAWGGDLAYAYARGELSTALSDAEIQAVLADANFGGQPQFVGRAPGAPIAGGENGGVVLGTDAGEEISGGDRADWLNGGGGSDTLTGGGGDDLLTGGLGADTYVYNLGDGVDTIADPGAGTQGNTVEFGAGITEDMLSLELGSLLVRIGDTGGALHLTSFDPQAPFGARDVDLYRFADGTVLTHEALLARGFDLKGTDGADTINGTATTDRIHGGQGDDVLSGGLGNDTYTYNMGDGADVIEEAGDTASTDILRFGAGIASSTIDVARDGDDIVVSLPSAGDEIRLAGWFRNTGGTIERVDFNDGTFWTGAQLEGRTQNQPPVLANPVADQTVNEDTEFSCTIPADSFSDPDAGDVLAYAATRTGGSALPSWLTFDAGTRTFSGTPGNADVATLDVQVTVTDQSGLQAQDTFVITVANVNDAPVLAIPITDQVATEDSSFTFAVPAGTFGDIDAGDVLTYGASQADGSPLPSWLSFDAQEFTFSGTPVNGDVGTLNLSVTATDLAGAATNDLFQITITNTNDAPTLASSLEDRNVTETVAFSFTVPPDAFADVDAEEILVYSATLSDGSSLPAWLAFNPQTRTFSGTAPDGSAGGLGIRVTATDQASAAAFDDFTLSIANYVILGTPGNDTLLGTSADDEMDGLAGDDTLRGGAGNDILRGGSGSDILEGEDGDDILDGGGTMGVDVLRGGSGGDTYLFGGASAHLRIEDIPSQPLTSSADRILVSADILSSQLTLSRIGNVMRLALTASAVADVADQFDASTPGDRSVEYIEFLADGTVWDFAGMRAMLDMPTQGADMIRGYDDLDDTILGLDGDDFLYGQFGNDTLEGGLGNDHLSGDMGDDIYVFRRGDGQDVIIESDRTSGGGHDTLAFVDIASSEVTVQKDLTFGNLILLVNGSSDRVIVSKYFVTGDAIIEDVVFADGTVWTVGSIADWTAINGTVRADNLQGTPFRDRINGREGRDTIYAGSGDDMLDGGAGADLMYGEDGDDTYIVDSMKDQVLESAGGGIDTVLSSVSWTLPSNAENLTLTGPSNIDGEGNSVANTIIGNAGKNTLMGGAGNDRLDGGSGNDTLDGQEGADTLIGGTGNDTYRLGRGYGADVVQENDKTAGNGDLARFMPDITVDQIWFQRTGEDLVASVIGSGDMLTVQNWYLGPEYRIEQFRTADGSTLLESNVQNLVNAMAAFAPPAPGQETLAPDYVAMLHPVIAVNWQ